MKVQGKFICFVENGARLYPVEGVRPNIDFDNAIVEIKIPNRKLKEQQLTEDEIEKVILDNKEIFIFEDSGMGEGIDYSKLAKKIIKAREEKNGIQAPVE